MKRGQVTIFIILGIVLLVVVLFFLNFMKKEKISIEKESDSAFNNYNYFFKTCVELSTKQAIRKVSEQGFFFNLPNQKYVYSYLMYNNSNISQVLIVEETYPSYFGYGSTHVPSKEVVEREIGLAMINYMAVCLNQSREFQNIFSEINYSEPNVDVSLDRESILFEVDYGVKLKIKKNKEYSLGKVEQVIHYDLLGKLDIVSSFVEGQKTDNTRFIVGNLTELAKQESFKYNVYFVGDERAIILFYFEDFETNGENPLKVGFSGNYNFN